MEIINTRTGESDFVMHTSNEIEFEFLDNEGNKKYLFISRLSDQFDLIKISNEPLFDLFYECQSVHNDGPGFNELSKRISIEIWDYEIGYADISKINDSEYCNLINYAQLKINERSFVGEYSDSIDFSNHARFLSSYYDDVSEKCDNNLEIMNQIIGFYEFIECSYDDEFFEDSEELLQDLLESEVKVWNEKIQNFKDNHGLLVFE